ncbi:5,10-methylenetetrahydrofolate reductase, small subunit [hydrothermal vent metagenome]|uniref:5,10-methylenetetrahydrofolate reductase, small subunit n=1 Tax=hydrothermal vent metagenome TaxID=652676 RepID=A0A3B0TLP8_9ZZZZ
MYKVRLWSVKHSRLLQTVYFMSAPALFSILRGVDKLFGRSLDPPITALEAGIKGFLFDCKMCGDCILSKTGMSCPMNCPKSLRNGPCGGVRENSMCEVRPKMACVWVCAWEGAGRMKNAGAINNIQFALDYRKTGTSSWLELARENQRK